MTSKRVLFATCLACLALAADEPPRQVRCKDLREGRVELIGVLGLRLGTFCTIEGVRPDRAVMMSNPVLVRKVDGRLLAEPVLIETRGGKLPRVGRWCCGATSPAACRAPRLTRGSPTPDNLSSRTGSPCGLKSPVRRSDDGSSTLRGAVGCGAEVIAAGGADAELPTAEAREAGDAGIVRPPSICITPNQSAHAQRDVHRRPLSSADRFPHAHGGAGGEAETSARPDGAIPQRARCADGADGLPARRRPVSQSGEARDDLQALWMAEHYLSVPGSVFGPAGK